MKSGVTQSRKHHSKEYTGKEHARVHGYVLPRLKFNENLDKYMGKLHAHANSSIE